MLASRKTFFQSELVILFCCLGLFLKNAAPTIFPGDSPEVITGALTLGVLHGLSFPFYLLSANLSQYFPLGSLAWRVNLFSVFCGVGAVFLLMRTARFLRPNQIDAQAVPAQLSQLWLALLLLGSSAFKYQVIRAEVYALYACLFLLVAWLAFKTSQAAHKESGLFLIVLIAGLLSGVHIYLSVPLVFILLVCGLFFGAFKNVRIAFFSLTIFLLAASVYLYLPLRASRSPLINFDGLEYFFAVKDYLFSFGQHLNPQIDLFERLGKLFLFFKEQLSLPLIVLVVFGFIISFRKERKISLVLALIGAANILVYFRHVDFSPRHLDTLGFELVAVIAFIILGSMVLFELTATAIKKVPHSRFFISGVITLILVFRAAMLWSDLTERSNFLAYRFGQDSLNSVSEGHLLIKGNTLTFPLAYLVHVENRGQKIKFYNPFDGGIFTLVKHPARYTSEELDLRRKFFLSEILNTKRPLYSGMMKFGLQGFEEEMSWQVDGLVYRLNEEARPQPSLSSRFLHWPKATWTPFDNKSRRIMAIYQYRQGEIAFEENKLGENSGKSYWQRAAQLAYDDAIFLADLGVSFLQINEVEEGIRYIERGLKINAGISAGYSNLAMGYYYGRGDKGKALQYVITALQKNPRDVGGRHLYYNLTGQEY